MTWVIKETWAVIILWKPCSTPIILTYNNDTYNKQIFRVFLGMRIVPCLIGISKQKHILNFLWIASHFRVLAPYFSFLWNCITVPSIVIIIFINVIIVIIFIKVIINYYYYTIKGFKIAACTLTARRLFTKEIENVMLWLANWNQTRCNVVINISYQTINSQETF